MQIINRLLDMIPGVDALLRTPKPYAVTACCVVVILFAGAVIA